MKYLYYYLKFLIDQHQGNIEFAVDIVNRFFDKKIFYLKREYKYF